MRDNLDTVEQAAVGAADSVGRSGTKGIDFGFGLPVELDQDATGVNVGMEHGGRNGLAVIYQIP